VRALQAGKHVFVEKPLGITVSEIDAVAAACDAFPAEERPLLMVGFNRRFSPHAQRMRALLDRMHEPKSIVMTVNAGAIPEGHWVHDPVEGGGRVIGELCHFVDLARFLVGCPIRDARIQTVGGDRMRRDDTVSVLLTFADGSWAAIHYLANGHRAFPKERVEVFCEGRILQLDNFRRLQGFGWRGFERQNLWRQDKGQRQCVQAFVTAVERGQASPIPLQELLEVSRVTVALGEAARA
jgi:predicted dehydrogenase